jgi:protein-disulfide isomerase
VAARSKAQDPRRAQLLRLLAGAAAIAIVGVVILIGFNALDGDDDASDNTIVIPTSVTDAPAAAGDASPATDGAAETTAPDAGTALVELTPTVAAASDSGTVHVLGEPDAPVTIVEWADYQCPFCGDFAKDVQPKLIEDYVNDGLVKLEFRDLAFLGDGSAGDESVNAAEAAWCAGDQGKFWEYHDTLYANQDGENEGAFTTDRLIEMARQLGLDVPVFENCLGRNTYESAIIASRDEAEAAGIQQTPTLFLNGERLEGVRDYNDLRQRIDTALDS